MHQKESFGIMDQCYFVPRGQIIDWVNNLLDINITKIQQFGSGAAYCQIVDIIHPGKVAMSKVNWRAKNDYEFINNLKILQAAFQKVGVKRYVEVEKLAKAKYQDNLQFIQWLKRYFDTNGGDRGSNYNAAQRRGNCQVDFSFAEKNVVPKTYNGSGQIIGTSKTDIAIKKSSNNNMIPSNRVGLVETKLMNKRQQSNSPQKISKRQQIKGNNNNKQVWQLKEKYQRQTKKRQQYEDRLEMILHVLSSGEDEISKVKMIQEIMNFNNNNNHPHHHEKVYNTNNNHNNNMITHEEQEQMTI